IVYEKKSLILQISLSSELRMLTDQLDRLAQKHRGSRDFTFNGLSDALQAVIASFPVYRSYITGEPVSERDRKYVLRAVRLARMRNPAQSTAIFNFIRDLLLLSHDEQAPADELAEQRR